MLQMCKPKAAKATTDEDGKRLEDMIASMCENSCEKQKKD